MGQFSDHRALASAMSKSTPSDANSSNPHEAATAKFQKVTLPQPAPDNRPAPKVTPVNLGKDQSRTSMTIVGDESQGMSGVATEK